jgi:hypothetical protein
MRRLLVISILLIGTSPVSAAVDPKVHKLCTKATDYIGCVQLNTAPNTLAPTTSDQNTAKAKVKEELKKLGARIKNSSLMTLSTNVRDFRDVLSLAKPEDVGAEFYKNLKIVDFGIDQLRSYWSSKIESKSVIGSCKYTQATADLFNATFSGLAVSSRCEKSCGLFGCVDTGRDLTLDLADAVEKAANMLAESDKFSFPSLPSNPKDQDCGKQPNKAMFNKCMSGG